MAICESCAEPVAEGQRLCPDCMAAAAQPTSSFVPVAGPEISTTVVAEHHKPEICLCVVKGPQVGECFYLDRPLVRIGRDPQAELFLNDRTVSREHATIKRAGDEVMLCDAGSLNGTYLNGRVIEEAPLKDGDLLQIGTFQLSFRAGVC